MTRRLLSTCFAILASVASHGASDGLDDVMQSLAGRTHGEASFVEQQFLSLLQKPLESSGELIYDAPNRLEKRTLRPRPESLLVDGDVLTVQRRHRTQVLELKSYPQVLPFIESIRATLAGDRAALERLFRVQFSGTLAHWSLLLVPLDPQLAKSAAAIRIEGDAGDLREVEIRQADGDRSLMTLRPAVGR